jgi:hypothetical protein
MDVSKSTVSENDIGNNKIMANIVEDEKLNEAAKNQDIENPISNESTNDPLDQIESNKYLRDFQEEFLIILTGIILIILSICSVFFKPEFADYQALESFNNLVLVINICIRVGVSIWVANIAKNKNLFPLRWGVLAFFFPGIFLIIIGKKKVSYGVVPYKTAIENGKIILAKAEQFYNEGMYTLCIEYAQKSADLNRDDKLAIKLLYKVKAKIDINIEICDGFSILYKELRDGEIVKLISKEKKVIGSKALLDDVCAPDGTYTTNSGKQSIAVANGVVVKLADL